METITIRDTKYVSAVRSYFYVTTHPGNSGNLFKLANIRRIQLQNYNFSLTLDILQYTFMKLFRETYVLENSLLNNIINLKGM